MKTHNDLPKLQDRAVGTRFVGYVNSIYDDLVRIFGEPVECEPGDDQKTDVEWFIEFDDGLLATIYNYKNGPHYLGSESTPVTEIKRWHVGGRRSKVLKKIRALLSR